jgi:DNA primase
MLTYCPFHKGGQETTPSFSINVEKGLFHCFTCHESGNMKRFLRLLGVAPAVIDVETSILQPLMERNAEMYKLRQRHAFAQKDPFAAPHILPETLLGMYNYVPRKLLEDGFDAALLGDLQVGYDPRGERIIYPLRDIYGNLAGFSGGATKDGQWPKYKVYQGSRRDQRTGTHIQGDFGPMFDEQHPGYTCENHLYLWGFDRIYARLSSASDPNATVFAVEGFKAAMWMKMAGFTDTVALMGSYISDNQQRLLHRVGANLVLFLDNDKAGRKATMSIGDLLWRPMKGRVEVVRYPEADIVASMQSEDENTQPDDYELETVQQLVRDRVSFVQHINTERSAGRWA